MDDLGIGHGLREDQVAGIINSQFAMGPSSEKVAFCTFEENLGEGRWFLGSKERQFNAGGGEQRDADRHFLLVVDSLALEVITMRVAGGTAEAGSVGG